MVALFGVAFGIVEGSVVVYLREVYYPGGFTFPLVQIESPHLGVEITREAATILMLAAPDNFLLEDLHCPRLRQVHGLNDHHFELRIRIQTTRI